MAGYKEPTLEERTALALKAREKALKKLAEKPPIDPAEQARRKAVQEAREAAIIEKSRAKKAAIEQAKREKQAAREAAAEKARKPKVALPTEADLKAARDAKYAARKARQK